MKTFVPSKTPIKKVKRIQLIGREVLFSLFALVCFAVANAQDGSECYKPFTGVGKVPNAVQNGVICLACGANGNLTNL